MMHFNILTIYPDFFKSILNHGLIKKGLTNNLIKINIQNLRDFSDDKHNRVDFKTYGGGPGMVLQYTPIKAALEKASSKKCYYLSPQGKKVNQSKLIEIYNNQDVSFICGRYEGIDQRVIDNLVDEELSIGDYVLSGGELPASVIIEGVTRLIPGIADDIESIQQDSFSDNLLDYPHYTRPESIDGLEIPNILKSGDHNSIRKWRRKQALGNTWIKRPDLLKEVNLSKEDDRLLQEFIEEQKSNKSE